MLDAAPAAAMSVPHDTDSSDAGAARSSGPNVRSSGPNVRSSGSLAGEDPCWRLRSVSPQRPSAPEQRSSSRSRTPFSPHSRSRSLSAQRRRVLGLPPRRDGLTLSTDPRGGVSEPLSSDGSTSSGTPSSWGYAPLTPSTHAGGGYSSSAVSSGDLPAVAGSVKAHEAPQHQTIGALMRERLMDTEISAPVSKAVRPAWTTLPPAPSPQLRTRTARHLAPAVEIQSLRGTTMG